MAFIMYKYSANKHGNKNGKPLIISGYCGILKILQKNYFIPIWKISTIGQYCNHTSVNLPVSELSLGFSYEICAYFNRLWRSNSNGLVLKCQSKPFSSESGKHVTIFRNDHIHFIAQCSSEHQLHKNTVRHQSRIGELFFMKSELMTTKSCPQNIPHQVDANKINGSLFLRTNTLVLYPSI